MTPRLSSHLLAMPLLASPLIAITRVSQPLTSQPFTSQPLTSQAQVRLTRANQKSNPLWPALLRQKNDPSPEALQTECSALQALSLRQPLSQMRR